MDDKNTMENLLLLEKGACDLMMHGTIESATAGVHQAFFSALSDTLQMQDAIYTKMAAKGWYGADNAPQNKITCVKEKFSAQANG